MPSPAFQKRNAATEAADMLKRVNMAAGLPAAGRSFSDQPVQVGSGTSVQSAAMKNPPPLTEAEQSARDARARELGLMPKEDGEDGQYGSLAEAQAAAGPGALERAQQERDRTADRMMETRQTAREFLGINSPIPEAPAHLPIVKLPDFRKVEGFDFFRNVLYIDGLEFEIPENDVRDMKRYAVDLALDHVVKQLAEALIAFGVPQELAEQMGASVREKAHGESEATEAVQEVRESGHQSGETPGL